MAKLGSESVINYEVPLENSKSPLLTRGSGISTNRSLESWTRPFLTFLKVKPVLAYKGLKLCILYND
jgi:hypothetical protein